MLKQLAAIALAVTSIPAMAVTYTIDPSALTSSRFSFGSVAADGSFSQFGLSDCSNIGISGTCYRGNDTYQVISASGNGLLVHPGPSSTSAIRFTAANTARVTLDGTAASLDSGSKIILYSENGDTPVEVATIGGSDSVALLRTFNLAAGQSFAIVVNNNGSYFNDSTRISGTIAAVPEPATWGMLALGFGLVGAAARRRRTVLA